MSKIIETTIIISNVKYIYPELPKGKVLRIAIGALTLENQKSNVNDDCHPMLCGWNENPSVGFADFQWWLKCRIEESNFIIGDTVIPFKEKILIPAAIICGELSVILEFKDGTRFRLAVRDEQKPFEVCVLDNKSNSIKKKIKEYGYTIFFD
ncbi:MAG: hypothetical protein ACOYMB_01925 [Patescibacteria group bacterium]